MVNQPTAEDRLIDRRTLLQTGRRWLRLGRRYYTECMPKRSSDPEERRR